MKLGIFARTYTRPTLEETLDAIAANGLTHVHVSVKSGTIDKEAFTRRGLVLASVSGTFNAIHPDLGIRRSGIEMVRRLMVSGAPVITLCTGTRDPDDMWRRHPANDLPDAWADLRETLAALLPDSEANGVLLGVEPEINNVINTAAKARRLLDDIRSPYLKIILDGANLFEDATSEMASTLAEAFDLLAADAVLFHAKDLAIASRPSQAAGKGALDWDTYCRLIQTHCPLVPVILHNLAENEVPSSLAFLKDRLAHAVS